MIAKGSRRNEHIQTMEAGEDPTTCVHCGTKAVLDFIAYENVRRERCPHCEQRYDVPPAEDDCEFDNFEPSEMAMKEASDADLAHLFGKTINHPDFGSF